MEHHEDPEEHFQKTLFAAVVLAQDSGMSVRQSRKVVAHRFGVTSDDVLEAEDEGIWQKWFPLPETGA